MRHRGVDIPILYNNKMEVFIFFKAVLLCFKQPSKALLIIRDEYIAIAIPGSHRSTFTEM